MWQNLENAALYNVRPWRNHKKQVKVSKKIWQYRKELRRRPTQAELRFRNILRNMQVQHIFQHVFKTYKVHIVDFYLPKYMTVIEIDGGYHKDINQVKADVKRDKSFSKLGIRVLRFTNEQTLHSSPIERRLKSFFQHRSIPAIKKRYNKTKQAKYAQPKAINSEQSKKVTIIRKRNGDSKRVEH